MTRKGEGDMITGREITTVSLENKGERREVRFGVTYTIGTEKLSVADLVKISDDAHKLLSESIERETRELRAEVGPVGDSPANWNGDWNDQFRRQVMK
jgi:hypothetical protein